MIWGKKTHQFLVGFGETNDVIAHGRNKVERKNLDMLIAMIDALQDLM
ncbi:MAG: phosphopantothenoylcysteine decarboxylase [Dialister invisus]